MTATPEIFVHKWDGTVRYVVTQDERGVARCAEMASLADNTIYFYADPGWSDMWRCDAHNLTTYGDCPKCDDEMIAGLS